MYTNNEIIDPFKLYLIKCLNKHEINYIDLNEIFKTEYKNHKSLLNFNNDYHWNKLAHRLVANSWNKYIKEMNKTKH
jgi:hypothetical protein